MLISYLGLVVHLLFFASIFDIYFRSPIIQGLTPYFPTYEPPAKRLVLFVADGLRADKLFELDDNGLSNAPFLRNVINAKGCWGISHTRVPTESRPGHVAIIAGLYEDVSAVTKGWKENPVNFDSVFNQSRFTWAWGSPDILPIFSKQSNVNIFNDMYSAGEEDFASEDPSQLDLWVAEKLENFLNRARQNETLAKMLRGDKIVFFLHLLALDTIGHAHKPQSKEYSDNIRLVDKLTDKCSNLVNDYFNDEKTAFVFTSDHGMTDWGSHGAGSFQETQTPLVVWGAGIRPPKGAGKDNHQDRLSESWKLSSIRRSDVNQADIAPLISSLIGIPIPVNSVGTLPVDYMGSDWKIRAEALILNAHQVLSQFKAKLKEKEETTLFHKQFRDLSTIQENQYLEMIDILMKQKRYIDSTKVSEKIIELALKGLNYYHKYDRFTLCISIFLSFLGWMIYVVLVIVENHTYLMHKTLENNSSLPDNNNSLLSKVKTFLIFTVFGAVATFILYIQSSPAMYYCYYLSPIFLWMLVCFKSNIIIRIKHYLTETDNWGSAFLVGFLMLIGLEILVLSFFYRILYTFILIILSTWPYFTRLKESEKLLSFSWCFSCLVMAIFPVLPVVGRESNYNIVTLSGWLSIVIIAYCAKRKEIGIVRTRRDKGNREPFHVVLLTGIQIFILILATYTVKTTAESVANKLGLPLWCQIVSWTILATSIFMPLFGSSWLLTRLLNIVASFIAVSMLMCLLHECFFNLGLCILLLLWLRIEHQMNNVPSPLHDISFGSDSWTQKKETIQKVNSNDLRRSFFFLFFILYAFFGVGNIASINSFEPTSVYCFLTVFSPFTMGFLLLIKIMIPFLLVSCFFRAILVSIEVSTRALFLMVLVLSDFMAMNFFFLVKDSGSWLEIGTSISHYVIMMSTILFVMLLYGLAWILTTIKLSIPMLKSKRHVL